MDVTWIEYKQNRILFSNYDGCITAEEMIDILHRETGILIKQERKVLVMSNYQNSYGSPKYMEEVIKTGKLVLKKKIRKTAVLGISGVKKVLFNAYLKYSGQKNVKAFSAKDEALEWLIKE